MHETDTYLDMYVVGRIRINKTRGGNAVIAHYKGQYEQMRMAYRALEKWIKKNDKAADGRPFEVYLDDPAAVRDPFELRTDIYQFIIDIPHSPH